MNLFSLPALLYSSLNFSYTDKIFYDVKDIMPKKYAIVFGAGIEVDKNGRSIPTKVLDERVNASVTLYKAHKVQKILMTGDSQNKSHDEVGVMKIAAINKGVKKEDILTDPLGLNTFESCNRAKSMLSIDEAIVITQDLYIKRAVYLCNNAGINAVGFVSDSLNSKQSNVQFLRELLAQQKAIFDVFKSKIRPKS